MTRCCLTIVTCLTWWATTTTAFAPRRCQRSYTSCRHGATSSASSSSRLAATIAPGDSVLVVGGTGGVGQLVTEKLRNGGQYNVRVSSRNVEQAREILGATTEVMPLDLIKGSTDQLSAALQGVSGLVISVGTTAFPTMKWRGGNTPQAIDCDAVTKLVQTASAVSTMKKIVLVTSVGVYRTDEMPFKILNLFGVLDAKRAGEDALKTAATANDVDYVIVRPGRLIGGPFTNMDVARLLQTEGGAENGVVVAVGDDLLGDCKRDACAEAIVEALQEEAARNVDFSLVSNEEAALKEDEWKDAFSSMQK